MIHVLDLARGDAAELSARDARSDMLGLVVDGSGAGAPAPAPTPDELLAGVGTGDRQAFAALYDTTAPRAGSNRGAVCQISRYTSCVTSSACAGSTTSRRTSPKTRGAVAS